MIRATALMALALAAPIMASAQVPPLEIKGVKLDSPISEFKARFPGASCRADGSACSAFPTDSMAAACKGIDAQCRKAVMDQFMFGPASASMFFAMVRDGRIGALSVIVSSADVDAVVDAMTQKYGKPSSDKTGVLQNRMGASFDNREVLWNRPDGQISVTKRSADIDTGAVTMMTASYISASPKDRQEKAKAAAKGL